MRLGVSSRKVRIIWFASFLSSTDTVQQVGDGFIGRRGTCNREMRTLRDLDWDCEQGVQTIHAEWLSEYDVEASGKQPFDIQFGVVSGKGDENNRSAGLMLEIPDSSSGLNATQNGHLFIQKNGIEWLAFKSLERFLAVRRDDDLVPATLELLGHQGADFLLIVSEKNAHGISLHLRYKG
jgi:hypothetical protein